MDPKCRKGHRHMGFVNEKNVMLHQNAATKEEALRAVAEYAVTLGVTDSADKVYDAFIAREEIDKTGMVDGFAVPHCKTDAVKEASVVIYKNETPLEWPSLDDKPVDIAMALLIPDGEAGTTHLRLLSKAAVLLMNDEFKATLRESDDAAKIAETLNAGLEA